MLFFFWPFWGFHFMGWIIWPFFIIFLIASRRYGFWGYRHWRGYGYDSQEDILKRRFASGEITREEYEERKKILERDSK